MPATCPYPEQARSSPWTTHSTPSRSILILSSKLRLGLPSDLFPSSFQTQNSLYTSPFPIRATCPTHFILLYFITWKILSEPHTSLCFAFCSYLHSLVTLPSYTLIYISIYLFICVCLYIYIFVPILSQFPNKLYWISLRHTKSLPVATLPTGLPVGHQTIRLVYRTTGFIQHSV